ncbi:MAG: hypothetical protein RMJ88_07410 [Thermogemmata sp.]|nr:hypothetical protein [Thermogemmata sp.]
MKELAIALFYDSEEAGTWSLLALKSHRGVISPNDLHPQAFLAADGSLRCYSDRIMCFLNTGAVGEPVRCVYFLLESLISLADTPLASEFPEVSSDTEFFGEKDVLAALFQENQTRLVVQDAGKTDLMLSYLNAEGNAPETRLSPYFRHVIIDKRIWQAAACIAIDEYICVAEERLAEGICSKLSSLVDRWKKHRSALTKSL